MTTLRQAAVAALEALEITSSEYCQGCWLEVIAALKEALARPDQLEDCKKILIERTASLTKANYRLEQLNKQEPTAWMDAAGDLTFRTPSVKLRPYWTPLYLHPTPVPDGLKLVPIEPTEEMIDASELVKQYELGTPWRRWEAMLAAAPKYEE